MKAFNAIINYLLRSQRINAAPFLEAEASEASKGKKHETVWENLNAAFLVMLAGKSHPESTKAEAYAAKLAALPEWKDRAGFYLKGVKLIAEELKQRCLDNPELKARLERAERQLAENPADEGTASEAMWQVFFPEGAGIRNREETRITELRKHRTVTLTGLNRNPIQSPATEILFTSNFLLTTPLADADLSGFGQKFRDRLAETSEEPQLYWYDHPIPIGLDVENNELLYGLRNFNQTVETEKRRRPGENAKVNFVLSVSVTHKGLQTLAKRYLKRLLEAEPPLDHLNVFAFTEADTKQLINQVLLPAVNRCCPCEDASDLLSVFGVDGRYGRHYSFLKAVAALWHVVIDPRIKATFKIDLDQVFPQKELIEQTGSSAFEHFQTPLWGAAGRDHEGKTIELGMIAGALVNQSDIKNGLFTADVPFPDGRLKPDEYIFFSKLPQALSTHAEMLTRYRPGAVPDGRNTCLQRIHVTGGTNGILVGSLRRFQPFTPGFIGRAEDQAYLLSTFGGANRLGYYHASGLFMRHDKESFARQAILKAKAGREISDHLRLLLFSAYAGALPQSITEIKDRTDPFTGCFISNLPVTVTLTRFALRVAYLFNEGKRGEAVEFLRTGIPQLREELDFTLGKPSSLKKAYERERKGWNLYYKALAEIERALQENEAWAVSVQKAAGQIVSRCLIT